MVGFDKTLQYVAFLQETVFLQRVVLRHHDLFIGEIVLSTLRYVAFLQEIMFLQ